MERKDQETDGRPKKIGYVRAFIGFILCESEPRVYRIAYGGLALAILPDSIATLVPVVGEAFDITTAAGIAAAVACSIPRIRAHRFPQLAHERSVPVQAQTERIEHVKATIESAQHILRINQVQNSHASEPAQISALYPTIPPAGERPTSA